MNDVEAAMAMDNNFAIASCGAAQAQQFWQRAYLVGLCHKPISAAPDGISAWLLNRLKSIDCINFIGPETIDEPGVFWRFSAQFSSKSVA
jgi:hypothetical protein